MITLRQHFTGFVSITSTLSNFGDDGIPEEKACLTHRNVDNILKVKSSVSI
eukprot:TRINITY_DN2155_c0_g1_i1.p3 TRINITY_DN2155_c0_g1~~TRINITY_DN2155_c0_g1_i1.p3  ORF type:complete len:51 (-),score=3.14 TRINITY_DN2155_c0_g1_i1:105-257(-)